MAKFEEWRSLVVIRYSVFLHGGSTKFQKIGKYSHILQKKGMSYETPNQETQFKFKHIFGSRVSGQSPKIGLEFKNISGSEKIKVFL